MSYTNSPFGSWSRSRIEVLMDISTTLAGLTESATLAEGIPAYLGGILGVEPMTLAVVRQTAMGVSEIGFWASSVMLGEAAMAGFRAELVEICANTRALNTADGAAMRDAFRVG